VKIAALLLLTCLLRLGAPAWAETLVLMPGEDLVGKQKQVRSSAEDTLLDIAHRHGYGYEEIKSANPKVDPWLPGASTRLLLPGRRILPDAPRVGIVVNLPEMRLYYYPRPRTGSQHQVLTYPIGIGKQGWQVPEMHTRVSGKERNPVWHVPESIRQERAAQGETMPMLIAAGDDNPLGEFALRLGSTDYLIHGTNKKYGFGMRVSHGCIRLEPAAIRQLFGRVAVGTPVRIVDQPYKAGTRAGRLYLEAHRPLAERRREMGKTVMVAAVIRATSNARYSIDWDKAFRVVEEAQGTPVVIGTQQPGRP